MTKEQQKLIEALNQFKEAAIKIGRIWSDDSGDGVTEYDDILNQKYPFKNAFFETTHDIIDWTNNAIIKLNNGGK